MVRSMWMLVIALSAVVGLSRLSAGEGGQRGARSVPWTMEQIAERLGTDNALSDEQKKKVEAVNAEFAKKTEEANKKEGVAAAQEEIKKAREANDRDAMRAAYKKLTELMGFNARDEYKKVLSPALSEAQIAKLFPARGPGGGERKAEEKK
jgi:hypothetical protein